MHSRIPAVAIAAAAVFAGSYSARADVKVVEKITIDSPQMRAAMQSMSPQQRKSFAAMGMGAGMVSTVYVSGKRQRTDTGPMSIYMDQSAHQMSMANHMSKTVMTMPLNAQTTASQTSGSTFNAVDTGKTMTILGHTARLFKISASVPARGISMTGDMWTARDIPMPSSSAFGGPLGGFSPSEVAKMKGMPLKFVLKMTNGQAGTMTISGTVTAISTKPLPASVFQIPAGYRKGPAPGMGMPGAGGPPGAP